jgi:hypothetical protein
MALRFSEILSCRQALTRRHGKSCAPVAAGAAALTAFFAGTSAQAALVISSQATHDVTCSAGVCVPTAKNAVLNARDLDALVKAGNVTVTTTGKGVQADNLDVKASVDWSTPNSLSLEAYDSILVGQSVSVRGDGNVSLTINNGGSDGTLSFGTSGHIQFAKLTGKLTINGTTYTLVNTIATLASAIASNPHGAYAFAADYDASKEGTYTSPPVPTTLTGTFEGLGNTISNLSIDDSNDFAVALFAENQGLIRDIVLTNASVITSSSNGSLVGTLAGENEGTISGANAAGSVAASVGVGTAGGLVGCSCFASGTIASSTANVTVTSDDIAGGLIGASDNSSVVTASSASGAISAGANSYVGGLVGVNAATIDTSYATGSATGGTNTSTGGLVGNSSGAISNSYATGAASGTGEVGGLIGENFATVAETYSTGAVTGSGVLGGLIGSDDSVSGSITNSYWDTTTSGITSLSQGAGNIPNDPGITGLTTTQLQSGLPEGFSKQIWGESRHINDGLPYLLSNPPS